MKKINLVVASALAMLLASGCADKSNVGYDDSSSTQGSAVTQNNENTTSSSDTMNNDTTSKDNSSSTVDDKLSYINVVTSNVNGKDVSLRSIHFDFDKYNLSDTMRGIEKENVAIITPLVASSERLKIKIEGNCDEWGTDEYNYALGLKRAKTVKDALINDGISATKISLVSYGESNPVCSDKSEMCWKKNRRVDHILLP